MVLKIVISKTDYTPSQLESIASIFIAKGDLFTDSGERKTFEVSFSGRQAMSKLAQVRRSIMKIDSPTWLVKNAPMGEYLN